MISGKNCQLLQDVLEMDGTQTGQGRFAKFKRLQEQDQDGGQQCFTGTRNQISSVELLKIRVTYLLLVILIHYGHRNRNFNTRNAPTFKTEKKKNTKLNARSH